MRGWMAWSWEAGSGGSIAGLLDVVGGEEAGGEGVGER
jgi:hypothetical protein